MNIIFMGTPDFAVPTLKEIKNSKHKISAVFSAEAKKRDRGKIMKDSPVSEYAKSFNIPLFTPSKLRNNPEIVEQIKQLKADIIVVVAYGFIIPKEIIDICKYGCINLHPSDLPKYRGAAPMQHTIANGEKNSAICVIQMNEKMDEGDILLKQPVYISDDMKCSEYSKICADIGAELVVNCLNNYANITPQSQNNSKATYASKLDKSFGKINWEKNAKDIYNNFRAFDVWPGTYFYLEDIKDNLEQKSIIKVEDCKLVNFDNNHQNSPGEIVSLNPLIVACKIGFIQLEILKLPGKSSIKSSDFVNGMRLTLNQKFF